VKSSGKLVKLEHPLNVPLQIDSPTLDVIENAGNLNPCGRLASDEQFVNVPAAKSIPQ
jgi:hypothetical protein